MLSRSSPSLKKQRTIPNVKFRKFLAMIYICDSVAVLLILFLCTFAKLRKATFSFVMSVRPHGSTRLPLEGFS